MKNLKRPRLLRFAAVAVTVASPVSPVVVAAEAPARADLVGNWVAAGGCCTRFDTATKRLSEANMQTILTLTADSTWSTRVRIDGAEDSTKWYWKEDGKTAGRWTLIGDSLWFGDRSAKSQVRKVALDEGQLVLGSFGIGAPQPGFACAPTVFQRADGTTLPVPPPTLKRADLTGRWTTTWTNISEIDTLTLNPDSTWTERWFGTRKDQVFGTTGASGPWWSILPGDRLVLVRSGGLEIDHRKKVTLQDGQFLLDRGCGQTYTRVKP